MINRASFWAESVPRAGVAKRTKPELFPGTKLSIAAVQRKLKSGKKLSLNIRPQLRLMIKPISYTYSGGSFKGHAIVVEGPIASEVCHNARHAARQTSQILRSYDRLVRERNLRDRTRVFDTTGED